MRCLPESGRRADAVVCVSDLAAFGTLTESQREGFSVPGDIAIGGVGAYERLPPAECQR